MPEKCPCGQLFEPFAANSHFKHLCRACGAARQRRTPHVIAALDRAQKKRDALRLLLSRPRAYA